MSSLLRAAEVKLDRIRQYDVTLDGISIEALPGKDIELSVTSGGAIRLTGPVAQSPQMLHLQHRIFGTLNSGTFTAGAWRRRPINHVVQNTIPGASYDTTSGSETFTLPEGMYWMELNSLCFYVDDSLIRLYNVTDLVDIDYGDAGMSHPAAGFNNTPSVFRGYVNLAAQKTLAVDHRCKTTRAADGFGYKTVLGEFPGIFANYMIWKVN